EAPFWMVALLSIIIAGLILSFLRPVNAHLGIKSEKSAFRHLLHTLSDPRYRIGFTATALLSVGGFMMMPFGSAFAINNMQITEAQLPMLFMASGLFTLLIVPFIGRFSDRIDKYNLFDTASIGLMVMSIWYTNLSVTPLWAAVVLNVLLI